MTKISRITTQKKSKNRYNIFLNDGNNEEYGFSVDEEILIEFGLRKNLELDEAMINRLVQKDTIHKSYARAIKYLGFRMRSKKEIQDYLIKQEVDQEHIFEIIEKLTTRKLIDDEEFSNMFVRTRIQTSIKGPSLVRQELIAKGVSNAIASKAVEQYSYEVQYEKAAKLIEKRMKQSSKHSYQKQIQQLQSTLIRNGFSQEVIKDALENIQKHQDDDIEWNALNHQGEKLIRRHKRNLSGNELRNKLKEALYRQGFAILLIDQFLDEKIK